MGTIIHRVTAISCQETDAEDCEKKIIDSGLKYFRHVCEANGYVQFLIPSTGSKLGFATSAKYELALAKLRVELGSKYEWVSTGYGHDFDDLKHDR